MSDTLHLTYDAQDGRITARYWGDTPPEAMRDTDDEYARVEGFSQASRGDLLREAQAEYVAGEDYDPETETVVARLYFDPDADGYEAGRIYARAHIEAQPDADGA